MKPEISFYLYIISTLIFTDSMVVQCMNEWWKKNVIRVKIKSMFFQCWCSICDAVLFFLIKMKISNYRSKIAPIRISCCLPALNFNKLIWICLNSATFVTVICHSITGKLLFTISSLFVVYNIPVNYYWYVYF